MDNNRIKILQVVGGLRTGGLETVAMNIVRYSNREKYAYDFLVYGEEIGAYEEEAKSLGCRIIHMHRSKNYITFYNDLKKVIKSYGEYDIVYSHSFFNSGIVLCAAKACGVKRCIAHAHNTKRTFDSEIGRKVFYHFMRKLINKNSDVLFACSRDAGRYVFGHDNFNVITNGIIVDNFVYDENKRVSIRKEFNIGERTVLGNVSRISEAKNHLFLIEIFKEYLSLDNNAVLMIVGDGELKEQAVNKVESLGISQNVIFTGTRKDIPAILSALDIFVFPSIHEGLGISAVEAQATGLKVLCSDVVPSEVKLTELLDFMSLSDSPKEWAQKLYQMKDYERSDYRQEIIDAGYDVKHSVSVASNFFEFGDDK